MTSFHSSLETYRRDIGNALDAAFPATGAPESRVVEAARYSLLGGGKRIRPVLLLASGGMFGLSPDALVPYACALEMIHTYSLIHDDLPCMDDDDLRRGQPTCHCQYGEATAILAGDSLLNRAFELLFENCTISDSGVGLPLRIRAASRMAQAAGIHGMIGGQALDLRYEQEPADEKALERLHRMKTGALIEASLLVPADLADAAPPTLAALFRYSAAIGLAFQIRDDLLDATASTETLGKTAGKDANAGKSTYVTRFGLARAQDLLSNAISEARDALSELSKAGYVTGFFQDMTAYLLERKS